MKNFINIVKKWLFSHEKMIVMIIVLCAISAMSYILGFYHGVELSPQPLMISRPLNEPIIQSSCEQCPHNTDLSMTREDCLFVGSINGEKYYPPSCPAAQKIVKENLRCFTSEKDAVDKGYELATSCN